MHEKLENKLYSYVLILMLIFLFSPATSNPQQVQISLDHDYCSSSAKMKRGQRSNLNSSISLQQTGTGNIANNVHQNIISTSRPVIRLHQSSSNSISGTVYILDSKLLTSLIKWYICFLPGLDWGRNQV